MLHTISEAVALTGKSRRTIYNHCDEGRVSYSVGPDGRRYFDTAELIRVYGELHGVAHPEPQESAQVCTALGDGGQPLTEATARRLAEAIEKLVALEEKRLMLLEHKPDTQAPTRARKVESFGDLLADLDD